MLNSQGLMAVTATAGLGTWHGGLQQHVQQDTTSPQEDQSQTDRAFAECLLPSRLLLC